MKDIINNFKKSDTWEIHLILAVNFVSCKDNNEECVIHSKSDKTENMSNHKAGEIIEELFQSLLSRYQSGLETSMRGSDFIFDCVHSLYYKCHKISFKGGGSCIDSPDCIKEQRSNNKSN